MLGRSRKVLCCWRFCLNPPKLCDCKYLFFIHGRFFHIHKSQDISVPEAYPLSDFDDQAVKTAYAESSRAFASAAEGSAAKATAQIEIETYSAIARALGVTL